MKKRRQIDRLSPAEVQRLLSDTRRSHRYLFGTSTFKSDFLFRLGLVVAMTLVVIGVWWLLYSSGGARPPLTNLIFLPVIAVSVLLGPVGGVVFAIGSGVLIGPLLPLDVASGEAQDSGLWMTRMAILTFAAGGVGVAASLLRGQIVLAHYLGEHNLETGLENIHGLQKRLEELTRSERRRFTLIVVEPKNLPEITLTLGIRAIPELFRVLSSRMEDIIGASGESAGRAGPPKIYHPHPHRLAAVLLEEDADEVGDIAQAIGGLSRSSFALAETDVYLDLYVGMVSPRADDASVNTLIHRAEIALHCAKESDQIVYRYDLGVDLISREALSIVGELADALEKGDLLLYYQPKLDLRTGQVVGVEALIRWAHPTEGLLLPNRFLPEAEKTSLIREITSWVLDKSIARAAAWPQVPPLTMAVNASPRSLENHQFHSLVRETVERMEWDPSRLEIEVTETTLMRHPDRALEILSRLRDMRVKIAIDDFGTGHSSLSYLGKLPATTLKIDRHFVGGLEHDRGARHIVDATIDLAHSFGMQVVAEGIETEAALDYLRTRGCDIGQGYYFARPMPESELLPWLRSRLGRDGTDRDRNRPPLSSRGSA